jgi:histone H1/5
MATKTAKKPAKAAAKPKTAAKAKTTAKVAAKSKTAVKAKAAAKPKAVAKAKATAKPKTVTKAKTVAKAAAKPKTAAKTKAPVKTMAKAIKNVKSFDAPKFQEFTIRDNSGVVGQVRLKPNAVAWKSKSSKTYQQISIDQLAALAAEHGRQVKA